MKATFKQIKTKTKNFADFTKKSSWIFKILWKSNFVGGYFLKF